MFISHPRIVAINDLVLRLEEAYAKKVFANKGNISEIINDDYVKEHVAWVKGILTAGTPEIDLKSAVFGKLEDPGIRTAIEAFFGKFGTVEKEFEKAEDLYKDTFSPPEYVQATARIATAQDQLLDKMKTNLPVEQYGRFFDYWQKLRKNFGDKIYQAPATTEESSVATTQETETKSTGHSIFTNYNVGWELYKNEGGIKQERVTYGKLTEENFSDPNKTIIGRDPPEGGVFPQIRNKTVSRKHGQILLVNGGLSYKDLNSTFGSLAVNHHHETCKGWGFTYELIPANVQENEVQGLVCVGLEITKDTKKADLPHILRLYAKKK